MFYRINELSRLAGVSVRTLRYYDEVGLLVPKRSAGGYRQYSESDLEKLQEILFWRELDLSLDKIKDLISQPGLNRQQVLQTQIKLLQGRVQHFQRLVALAQDTLDNEKGVKKMDRKDLFTAFNYEQMMEDQKQYEVEAKERWGNTDAYRISRERTARYSKEDWESINQVQMQNLQDLARLYQTGVPYDHPEVLEVVDRNRRFISESFYPCSLEVFSGLGQMYVSDERFTAYYDRITPGLAAYYNNAIQHYCILNS